MGACQEVSRWITENVLVPVERFITEAREACAQVGTWVEEEVWQPIENWVSQQERRCREQSCNWWCLCCNKWFCWIVVVVVRVVTWVVVTVLKWVVELVCEIVTIVVGIVVELVLKIIQRLVSFVVCIFTDPGQAFKTLWDLWNDIVDAVEDVFDLVTTLLDDVIGILNDVGRLVDGLGRSFCIFGEVVCAVATAIFGFIGGIIDWVADIVDWIRDTVTGIRDLVAGILTLNWCRIQGGLRIFNVLRVITSVTRIPAGWFYSGPGALISVSTLEGIIDQALVNAFSRDPERLRRSRDRARLGGSPVGLPVRIAPWRLAIRSSEFLRGLAREGAIDLHALAGRVSDCSGKFIYDQFAGEVVYTGTSTKVSQSDLDTFLSEGPEAVASFTVFPITTYLFRRYLEVARRKGFDVGLNFTWKAIAEIAVDDPQFAVRLQSDVNDDASQKALLTRIGRPSTNEDLSEVPSIAVFGYRDTSLHGLTSSFRPTATNPEPSPTGTTFRTRFPEVAMRFVPIHEIGHYFGLNHSPGHDSARYIMWSPKESGHDWGETVLEYGFLTGEAIFTEEDARGVWNWITTTAQARDRLLP
jgi:hypothetical protein